MTQPERRDAGNQMLRVLIGKQKESDAIVNGKLDSIELKVDITNGRVTRNEKITERHGEKIAVIEKTELFEEGVRTGRKSMKTSTRNLIILIISIIGVSIAVCTFGIREIRGYKSEQISHLENQLSKARLYFNNKGEPMTKGMPW